MPRVPDASSFTRFQKVAAQSISTAGKKPTASSVPSVSTVLKGVTAAVVKASEESKKISPSTSILATSTKKGDTSKRG